MEYDDHVRPVMTNNSEDYYDEWDLFAFHAEIIGPVFYLLQIVSPILIFGGVACNILALVVIVKGRLWLKHEGYVYLAATFCANMGVLVFCTSSIWLLSISARYYPPNTSEFMCRLWHFMQSIMFAPGWLSVALLLNVYLREHMIHRRRCGCPMFASKYCTLFATKIIVGVIFGAVAVVAVPYLAFVQIVPRFGCVATASYTQALIVEISLMWGLPLVIFLIVVLAILCTSREGNSFGFSQFEERNESDEQMRVVTAIVSSMIFLSQFVLFVPLHSFLLYSVTYEAIVVLVYGLSTALQPILCFVILKALRDGFRSQLRNIRCCRRMLPSLDPDEDVVQLTSIQEDPPDTSES